jgi:hypothetical protein
MRAERDLILNQRIQSEYEGLFHDIALWKEAMPQGTIIRHHIDQFETLCNWMRDQLEGSFEHKPGLWPNLDQSTFKTLIVSVLSGKWILLRQVVQQRLAGSPYLDTLAELDAFADSCYRRLRTVLMNEGKVEGLSESSPLVYLGPIARLFLFDEEAPCLISAPFGAANDHDPNGKNLCRQTVPHEVGHAIFEQMSGLIEELKFKVESSLTSPKTKKQKLIRSVIRNWLEEVVADITGTALGGLPFAESASQINIMPERLVGITDGEHPIPLLRSFVHGWVMDKLDPEASVEFSQRLSGLTSRYLNRPFESLPAVIPVNMKEVRDELLAVVEVVWNCELQALQGCSVGHIFQTVYQTPAPSDGLRMPPGWGSRVDGSEDVIFRLVGPFSPASPLPDSPLYLDPVCCRLKIQFCCSETVM